MKQIVEVVFAKGFNFQNEKREWISGGELHVKQDGETYEKDGSFSGGSKIAVYKTDYEVSKKVYKELPAMVEVELSISVGRDNNPILRVVNADVLESLNLTK